MPNGNCYPRSVPREELERAHKALKRIAELLDIPFNPYSPGKIAEQVEYEFAHIHENLVRASELIREADQALPKP